MHNIIVISYSLTGNNDALASGIAIELKAKHVRISDARPRSKTTIILDILFNRIPDVKPIIDKVDNTDLVIFVGPVWLGHVATPLRTYFKHLKGSINQYVFVSISGGADGPNLKLADELTKRLEKKPMKLIDLHIADFLPPEPKPTRKETSAYHLSDDDVKALTTRVAKTLRATITKIDIENI